MIRKAAGAISTAIAPLSLWAHKKSDSAVVLLFHRVSKDSDSSYPPLNPREFESHCEFLKTNFQVIPLNELMKRKNSGSSLQGLASISFDDGYADFLTDAYPILKRHGLHSTHFLVSDCVESGKPTWNLRIKHLIRSSAATSTDTKALANMDASDRNSWLSEKESKCSPSHPPMLRAEDLKKFDSSIVHWGSHTCSHGMLPNLSGAEVERELHDSRVKIETWAGNKTPFFSYPNGMYSTDVIAAVKASGYESAFAVGQGKLAPETNVFAIPRIDIGAIPSAMLASEITGVNSFFRKLRG